MIEEKGVEEFKKHIKTCENDYCLWEDKPLHEMLKTIEVLWKVARAAEDMDNPYFDYGRMPIKPLRKALAALREEPMKP